MRYYIISALVVIGLCAYVLYLTYKLAKAEELNAVYRSNLSDIRDSLNTFERNFPALYFIHQEFFSNIRKNTYNRK